MTTLAMIAEATQYQNGNCTVTLFRDGSKTREWEGDATPTLPESIDLKITDWCDAGCPYCHESSTRHGKLGSIDTILEALEGAQPGMEIAIGGGDPFSHPQILSFLRELKSRGLIPNITVNARHLVRHTESIRTAREIGTGGIGISWHPRFENQIRNIADSNTILHFIAGNDRIEDAIRLGKEGFKILVLGYKNWGRGALTPEIRKSIEFWRFKTGELLRSGTVVCFDNLGLDQLAVKQWLPEKLWQERFMGDDGGFTMYVDGVIDSFAKSSTSPRIPREGKTLREMFEKVST